jgi:hypothetical protein
MTESEFIVSMRLLIRSAVEKAKDGLTLAEAGQLFVAFIQIAMQAAAEFRVPGAAKKDLVMASVAELFDALSPYIPLPWFLLPFRAIVVSKLRAIVLSLTSGIVEAIYAWWQDRHPDPTPAA